MENANPVIQETACALAHVPDLVRYGSKPRREIGVGALTAEQLAGSLRSLDDARSYLPNRVFTGELSVEELARIEQPWFKSKESDSVPASPTPFGETVSQDRFYALLRLADALHPPLFELTSQGHRILHQASADHFLFGSISMDETPGVDDTAIADEIDSGSALPIESGGNLIGCFRPDNRAEGRGDPNVSAQHLLEALCAKASAGLALNWLLRRSATAPEQIEYIISCGEEACGDRYQRGGGGMAKAVGEMCGCINASGMDVKNFCAAPASALITAGALVKAGVYDHVAVVAGGSLAKLGMKLQGFLYAGVPILDDCLASMAFLVTRDDGHSPLLHLERGSVGLAAIGSSTSDEAVYRDLILKPLDAMGLKMTDIDKYATELHNPEIMKFAGSGDVTKKNYRTIAAMAVMSGLIDKAGIPEFIERVGMSGFAPTQGHIPSAVPYVGHAARAMRDGKMDRVMFLCKASLFLNRITQLYDGVSFVLERNPGHGPFPGA